MRKNSRKLNTENSSTASPSRFSGKISDPMVVLSRGKEPLQERVYSHLRSAILSGSILPEERLVEELVARALEVSRTPVREALHKLEREGLIEHFPNRGFAVAKETESQVAEIFEIRAILEGYILRIACESATDDFLSELKSLLEKAERCFTESKIEELHRINTMFHDRIIYQVSGRVRLKSLVKDLTEYVLRYRSATLQFPGGAERTLGWHEKIILALETGDPDLCERIMRAHIEGAKTDAIRELMERKTSPIASVT
ncbi:MAG: GntR family transcriptional regulator [Thermodesulfobacteriota bacterium]